MIYLYAFLVGGIICFIAQMILELFHLSPGHITCLFVIIGTFLEFFSLYDKLINFSGAGAMLPITSFGHSLAHSAYNGAIQKGILGLSSSIFDKTSNGIVYAIIFAVIIGVFCKPKG